MRPQGSQGSLVPVLRRAGRREPWERGCIRRRRPEVNLGYETSTLTIGPSLLLLDCYSEVRCKGGGGVELRATLNSSEQPVKSYWATKVPHGHSIFFSDISDKKALDDKDSKTKKKKQKKEKNEDDDESSKKDKDDKKDKKKVKRGKVRVFVGQYLFSLMFFRFLREISYLCRAATFGYRTTEICLFVDDIIPTLSIRVFVGTCCVIYTFFSFIERLILYVA